MTEFEETFHADAICPFCHRSDGLHDAVGPTDRHYQFANAQPIFPDILAPHDAPPCRYGCSTPVGPIRYSELHPDTRRALEAVDELIRLPKPGTFSSWKCMRKALVAFARRLSGRRN